MGQPTLLHFGTVCGGGVREGTVPFAQLSLCFLSLSLLPTSNLCSFRCCADTNSWVGGLVYILGTMGPSNVLSCETGSCSCLSNMHRFLQPELLWLYFPCARTQVCMSCLNPKLFLLVYPHTNVGPPGPLVTALPHVFSAPAVCLCPSYQSV